MIGATREALLLVGACALLQACGSHAPGDPSAGEPFGGEGPTGAVQRDVLFVTMDTTRPDLFGIHGHDAGATPSVDALAARGALFERHYSTSPMTGPSHASMFTGLLPSEHGLLKNGRVLPDDAVTVAEVLGDAGYATAAVVGSRVLEQHFGVAQGFDVYEDRIEGGEGRRANSAERPASEVVDLALEVIASRNPDAPLFLWVHVFDPHRPFDAAWEYDPEQVARFLPRVEPTELFAPERLAVDWAMYEAEIAATDAELGRLFAGWDARGGERADAVVVTADHGEGMGEHDYLKHMLYLYEEQIRVPFVVRAEGLVPAGVRHARATSMLDVATTLTQLAGVDGSAFEGHDLTALVEDDDAPRSRVIAERPPLGAHERSLPDLAAALEAHPDRGRTRGDLFAFVADDDGGWSKFLWSGEVQPELYDLVTDPAELDNLVDERSDRTAALARHAREWREGLGPTPEAELLTDEDTLEMLEQLGYR